jgi:hypothetical protein
MKRDAIKLLYAWKEDPERKPLIIYGARQVGKTWLMKQFAAEAYSKSFYVNFEEDVVAQAVFQKDFDINRIIHTLELLHNVKIDEETLLLFDEIQAAPRGVTALKYFCENAPQYAIIAAGSMLGTAMHANDSFPVGKVQTINLYPLSFLEYLDAKGFEQYRELLETEQWEMAAIVDDALKSLLREYYFVGGMPEAVNMLLKYNDFNRVREVQRRLLNDYERDFSKHAPAAEVPEFAWSGSLSRLN